jgi:putative FmdB family regulatory protein
MPIYEYRCGNCGHELEAIQKMSDPVLEACPGCGQDALKRLISAPSFRLKGGGWYETDFKQDGKRNVHEAESKAKPETPPCAASGSCPAAACSTD